MSDEVKHFRYPTEFKQVDMDARTFEGYASTWDRDLQDDTIERGAFRNSLSRWRKDGYVIPLLDSHSTWSVKDAFGKLMRAEERQAGLWTKWKVVDGPDGDGILNRIADGIVDAMSIGYRAIKWTMDTDDDESLWGHRILHEVDLKEVSLVLFPANPGARISAVKMFLDEMSDDERKKVLAEYDWHEGGDPVPPPPPLDNPEPEDLSVDPVYDSEKAAQLTARLQARLFARRIQPLKNRR